MRLLISDEPVRVVMFLKASFLAIPARISMFVRLNYLKIRSVLREINARKDAMEEMGAAYMAEGIITLGGSRMYTSMADTDEVVDDALTRFARVFDNAEQHENE